MTKTTTPDDSDDFLSKPRFPSPMPRQRTSSFRTFQPFPTSSMQANEDKRREKAMKKMKKMRKQEENYEKMKKKIDAKARTIIRNSIDAKAFERSTYDCKTAHELWIALKPTEAYTEEEIHRALGRVRIETCSNDMELVERMYDVVNKA